MAQNPSFNPTNLEFVRFAGRHAGGMARSRGELGGQVRGVGLAATRVRRIFPSHHRSRPPRSQPPSRATVPLARRGPCTRRGGSTASRDDSSRRRFGRRTPLRCLGAGCCAATPRNPAAGFAVSASRAESSTGARTGLSRRPLRLRRTLRSLRFPCTPRASALDISVDICVPQVPPRRRAPAFEPAQLMS